jgi:hypothetical protein
MTSVRPAPADFEPGVRQQWCRWRPLLTRCGLSGPAGPGAGRGPVTSGLPAADLAAAGRVLAIITERANAELAR